ncbi:MAG: response regulator, partial [Eubacterium sp.]|nr:response regulator [Eubacterium sp.]
MNDRINNDELVQTSHMAILKSYTAYAIALIVVIFLLGWEKWAIIPILAGVAACWYLHIKSILTDYQRLWVYGIAIMVTFFFYGIHHETTYDIAVVMASLLVLFTITGVKELITFNQCGYYITLMIAVIMRVSGGEEMSVLTVCRIILHIVLISAIAYLARSFIGKWEEILVDSIGEVATLKESTGRLNDFLANVSHELRTPVNAIIGLSSICAEKERDEEIKRDMLSVKSAGFKVASQISDILDYSEIDRGNLVLNEEDYMLSSLMNDIMADVREYMHTGTELTIDIDPATPAVMHSDSTKIKKIFKALISNGLKYTPEGGVYTKVFAEKRPYGVNLCIEVRDTGIGMTEEELSKVYEKYYQSDSSRTRSSSGLGLGLGIVSGFVKLLGGFMTINSQVNQETVVRVSIPQKVINEKSCMSITNPEKLYVAAFLHFDKFPNPLVREFYNHVIINMMKGLNISIDKIDSRESLERIVNTLPVTHLFVGQDEYEANSEYIDSISSKIIVSLVAEPGFTVNSDSEVRVMEKPFYSFPVVNALNLSVDKTMESGYKMMAKGVRALVVDDEPMNLVVAKSIFKRYGMEVSTADSGQAAIDVCRETTYDIIFMDHMMGSMDGVEAMKRIRNDVSGLNQMTPVVALTANAMSSAKRMFMDEGFDGFVSKPIEIEELERNLRRILPQNAITYVEVSEFEKGVKKSSDTGSKSENKTENKSENKNERDSEKNSGT